MMTDEDYELLGSIESVDAFVAFVLARDGKASSADMHAIWVDMGKATTPKAAFKRARDAAVASGGAPAEAPEPGLLESLRKIIQDRVTVEGKSTDLKTLTQVYTFVEAIVKDDAPRASTEDWTRLTRVEVECLLFLTAKLNGGELDPSGEWYESLLARVPAQPEQVHPAHVPLPPGQPALSVVPPV